MHWQHSQRHLLPPVDVDAIAREMAIKAKAIQQQARQDPALTAVAQQAEQITDEQQAAAQALTNDAMKKAASSQTAAQIGKVFGDMKQNDLVAVLGGDKAARTTSPKQWRLARG